MCKLVAFVMAVVLLASNVASAGPLTDAVSRYAQATRPVKGSSGENKMLWPGLGLIVGGGVLALYGFSHTTGLEVGTNTTGTVVTATEKHATGVGFAGLGIAGVGAYLLLKGQKEARGQKRISFGLNSVTVRF